MSLLKCPDCGKESSSFAISCIGCGRPISTFSLIKIGRFIIDKNIDDGIVKDEKTGLMWCRFELGQTWQNGTVQGEAKWYTWKNKENKKGWLESLFGSEKDEETTKETIFDAVNAFNRNGGYANFTDWRIPTIDELKTLIDKIKSKENCCIDADVFPNHSDILWSSSLQASDRAWYVFFTKNGGAERFSLDAEFRVRLVR